MAGEGAGRQQPGLRSPADERAAATQALTGTRSLPAGGWTLPARQAALARFRQMGVPVRRDEYWRHTRPDSLVSPTPPSAAVFVHDEAPPFSAFERLRIVFVDGQFDAEASDPLALEGVTVERLADVAGADLHWARDLYGALEAEGQQPVPRPLAAFNTAFAEDGVLIHVHQTPSRPISIIYRHEQSRSDAMLHHVVKVDPGASVTLLENGPAAARFNCVLEADLGAGARLSHVRAQGRDHERRAITHVFARLGAEAAFKSFTLSVNGQLVRNETVVTFDGDDALAHVAGAAVGDGDFHHDDTVFVTHDAERCESRQVFKKVLRNGAVGVFQGKILVRPGAQKTDGYQKSQALMLDGDSQFLAKPELEIYADDVACSHGSTSGGIDDAQLFYLRSRGVPRAEAVDLLTLAFLGEAIDEIENDALREDIRGRVQGWLHRHRSG